MTPPSPALLRSVLLTLSGLLAACAADADYDGFARRDDCDDADPFVYPGAPDDPGDGLDADCNGRDPDYAFPGTWSLVHLNIDYAGLQLIQAGTESGTLDIADDGEQMSTILDVTTTLDPAVLGSALAIDLELEGSASPLEGPDLLTLYVEGEIYREQMHIHWDCAVIEDVELICSGELKAFEGSLTADAEFVLP